MTKKKN